MSDKKSILSDLSEVKNDASRLNMENELKKGQLVLLLENQTILTEQQKQMQTRILEVKKEIKEHQKTHENLADRNGAIKSKFGNLNEDLKQKADSIFEKHKAMLKIFGLKMNIKPGNDKDVWDVMV
jgi:hypothetical protein